VGRVGGRSCTASFGLSHSRSFAPPERSYQFKVEQWDKTKDHLIWLIALSNSLEERQHTVIEQIGCRDGRLAVVELGKAYLGVGVDEGLLVDAPNATVILLLAL
jgi:hypothetical protein